MKKNAFIFLVKLIFLHLALLSSGYSLSAEVTAKAINDGIVAFDQGHYKKAEEYFLTKIREPELNNEAFIFLSKIYLINDDTELAIHYVEQALAASPNNAEEVLLSGHIYCNQGQKLSMFAALKMAKKCITQYSTAVDMAPENVDALVSAVRFYLGAPAIAGGSTKKGSELLERLSRLSPEDANIFKIQLLEKEEKTGDALRLADELSKKGFLSANNQYEVAHYYRDKKLYDKAKFLFEPLLTWQETPANRWYLNDSYLQLGEIYLAEGKNANKGVELIEKYKQKNNKPQDIHYFWSTWSLAKGYKAIGQQDKYETLVKQIKSENYKKNGAFAKEFEAYIQ